MKRVFLDANIIIGLLYEGDRLHRDATLAANIALKRYHTFISPATFVICQRKIRKLVHPRQRNSALKTLLAFNYCTENQAVMNLVAKAKFHNKEDALQYFSALTEKPDAIVTEDVHDFQPYASIPVYHPVEFIQMHV